MLEFCKKTKKKIYIYGLSKKGKIMYQYLKANNVDVKGFIISDGQSKDTDCAVPVVYLSEVDGANTAILMGISYHWYNDIFPEIVRKGITDIYFLNGTENYSALQKYDDWFERKHKDGSEVYLKRDFSYKMARKIFNFIRKKGVVFSSGIDFGGGSGAWAKALKDEMKAKILVLDGNDIDRSAILEKDEFIKCDFTSDNLLEKMGIKSKFDCAMSIEVAEHLDEKYADAFIDNICRTSDVVIFSAAIKYQGGNHHVNEQMQSYWAKKFSNHGYKIIDCIREPFWNDEEIDGVVRQNCFIYVQENKYIDLVRKLGGSKMPMDVVHPALFKAKMNWHEEGWL